MLRIANNRLFRGLSTLRCNHRVMSRPGPFLMSTAMSFSSVVGGESHDDFSPKKVESNDEETAKTLSKISDLVKSNKVVLFMKGTPDAPQCGFSRAVVKILAAEGVDDYVFADVLKSPALREGVKKYSEWPTIPQVYVAGEFVGGCDILVDMHKKGELKQLLQENGVKNTNT